MSSTPKTTRRNKKKPSSSPSTHNTPPSTHNTPPSSYNTPPPNFNINPLPGFQQCYRPLPPSFDQPIFSPANIHYASPQSYQVSPTMYQFPYIPYPQNMTQFQNQSQNETQNETQTQTQTQTQNEPDPFDGLDVIEETQFDNSFDFQAPRHLNDESSDSSEDIVPPSETEASEDPREKTKRKTWTPDEEKALAEAWLDISEDPVKGKNQAGKKFKIRVWDAFCVRMGKRYRSWEQIYSKWRTVNREVTEFNGIFGNVARKPPSGVTGSDIYGIALELYATKHKKPFKHPTFWDVVKDAKKWKNLELVDDFTGGMSKRSKTSSTTHSYSSDGRTDFDLNNPDPYEEPTRHMGRDKAKAMAKRKLKGVAGSTSSDHDSTREMLKGLDATLQEIKEVKKIREENRAIELVSRDVSHLDEEKRSWMEKAKAKLMKKFTFDD